jgi:hypothetical protein
MRSTSSSPKTNPTVTSGHTSTHRDEDKSVGIGQTGRPRVSTAYIEDDVPIDGHPLDIPPPPTTEPPPETRADSAPQENATNIPHHPGQILIPIEDQTPTLTGNQIVAVNPGRSERHPLVRLLSSDVGPLIVDYAKPQLDLTATRKDETLQAIRHLYNHLRYVNKDLNGLIKTRFPCNAETQAILWLHKLNRVTSNFLADQNPNSTWGKSYGRACAALSLLIKAESDIDVRLPNQPHAQRRRAEVLAQRLVSCGDIELVRVLLAELFDAALSVEVAAHQMFIDRQHLALSALGAFVRRFSLQHDAVAIVQHIIAHTDDMLSDEQRAALFVEMASSNQRTQMLRGLDRNYPEFPAFRQFVREACLFLNDPSEASDELRETMIDHLEQDDTSWTPSNVQLIEALADLVNPAEGVTALSNAQTIRVQRILTRYMEALNAMHADIHMSSVRAHLYRIPNAMLMSAFNDLAIYDRLKIAGIILDPYRPTGREDYLAELDTWLPVIRNVLGDRSIPIEYRRRLMDGLFTELAQLDMSTTAAVELTRLRDDLARIAEYQGN